LPRREILDGGKIKLCASSSAGVFPKVFSSVFIFVIGPVEMWGSRAFLARLFKVMALANKVVSGRISGLLLKTSFEHGVKLMK